MWIEAYSCKGHWTAIGEVNLHDKDKFYLKLNICLLYNTIKRKKITIKSNCKNEIFVKFGFIITSQFFFIYRISSGISMGKITRR